MILEPSWATVLWVGAMALGLGIAIGRVQIGMKWVRADEKRRRQINVTLNGSGRYSRDDVRALTDQLVYSVAGGGGGGDPCSRAGRVDL